LKVSNGEASFEKKKPINCGIGDQLDFELKFVTTSYLLGINPVFLVHNWPNLWYEEIEHNIHFFYASLSNITNNT
jgi:hypothetical protein